MKQKLEQFKAADYTFADARECKFVEKLCEVRTDWTLVVCIPHGASEKGLANKMLLPIPPAH